jgi:Anti-sigma-K factor rskA
MPLSADQQALLELLLQRGQGYDDIASLLDVSEGEVRSRAREALTELGGADPDRNVGLTDWLLGQADPIGRADAARHVRDDPADHRLASSLVASLHELAPRADLPKLPPAPGGGRFLRRGAAAEAPTAAPVPQPPEPVPASRRAPSLEPRQTRTLVAIGSAAVILIAVVLGVTGAFGGGDDATTASPTTTTEASTGDSQLETVELRPSRGGDASGTATFGITSDQAYVDLDVSNLEPAPEGRAYVLWLLISEDQGHPLQPFQASQDGTFTDRIPIQAFLTQLAARTQAVDVSLSAQGPLLDEVNSAVEEGSPVIAYTGESIMRGEVGGAPAGGAGGASAGQ